ncbi:MAG: hypothetical protein V1712_02030 [Patescibacteria group bacterium]
MRHIQLEVIVPEVHVWKFIAAFGKTFTMHDSMEGTDQIKAVDHYYCHPNGWHITVTVFENDENKFYQFFHSFCRKNQLTFRGSEKPEFDENFLAYNSLRSDQKWLEEHKGKWVIFVDGQLISEGGTKEKAFQAIKGKYLDKPHFYTQVKSFEEEEVIYL